MRRIIFLFSMLLLAITVNAQYYRRVIPYYGHHVHYHPSTHVVVREHVPYYEEKVVYVREKPQRNSVVVNNYIVNNNKREIVRNQNNCDDNEYFDLNNVNETTIVNNQSFDYDDMWSQTVWFKRGSYSKLRNDGKIALDNVHKFLCEHSDAKIVLYGYASRKYGTYDYNKDLAKKRLYTVSDYLVNVYRLDWSRIEMRVVGTSSAEYDEDSWNQCVVIKCER